MKLTKLVSIKYKTKEEKARAEETFKMIESIEGAEVKEPEEIIFDGRKYNGYLNKT